MKGVHSVPTVFDWREPALHGRARFTHIEISVTRIEFFSDEEKEEMRQFDAWLAKQPAEFQESFKRAGEEIHAALEREIFGPLPPGCRSD